MLAKVVLICASLFLNFQKNCAFHQVKPLKLIVSSVKCMQTKSDIRMSSDDFSKGSPHSLAHPPKTFDPVAAISYVSATSLQWVLLMIFLHVFQITLISKIPALIEGLLLRFQSLPGFFIHSDTVLVAMTAFFLSTKSRIFSPLDNSRPAATSDDPVFKKRIGPSWAPPRLAFPIIWTTISILRMLSTVVVYKTSGTLLCVPIFAFMAHLSIGDTWNTINNVENRLGTAVLAIQFVWASVIGTTYLYYQTNPLAGMLLAPSCIWLTIASFLVYSIWRLNAQLFNRPTLFPSKEEGPPSAWRLPFSSLKK